MADEKKYKYTVKKFAKMLTVHPDKRVTFEDTVDIRNFCTIRVAPGVHKQKYDALSHLVAATLTDGSGIQANETAYWDSLVEEGNIFSRGIIPVRVLNCESPFHMRVEFTVCAVTLAEWLAETGFPQMSRAKEETPNANPNVAG